MKQGDRSSLPWTGFSRPRAPLMDPLIPKTGLDHCRVRELRGMTGWPGQSWGLPLPLDVDLANFWEMLLLSQTLWMGPQSVLCWESGPMCDPLCRYVRAYTCTNVFTMHMTGRLGDKRAHTEAKALPVAASATHEQSGVRQAPSPSEFHKPSMKTINKYLQLNNAPCLFLATFLSPFPLCFYAVGDLGKIK